MRSSQLFALLVLAGEVTPHSHVIETSYETRPSIGREQGRQRRNRFSNTMSTTRITKPRSQDVPANLAVDLLIMDTVPDDAVTVSAPTIGNEAGLDALPITTGELVDGNVAPTVEEPDALPEEQEEPSEKEEPEEEDLEEEEDPEEENVETGVPVLDLPTQEQPTPDLPVVDIPVVDVPVADVPVADVPVADVPIADVPAPEVPGTDLPTNDPLPVDLPPPDVPPGDVPAADVPAADVPGGNVPADAPEVGNDGPDGGLIGDLNDGILSPEGQNIADILLGNGNTKEENFETGTRPNFDDHTGCDGKDPCCRWYYISEELTGAFLNADGTCNSLARQSIRMGFHDAGTWSAKLAATGQNNGGADGSLVLFGELTRPENFGLDGAAGLAHQLYDKYNVTMADLIQYMANHAVVSCPLGPRVRTYIGRKDATEAAPEGLLPSVHAQADDLIALFADKTISAHELTALMGAHSTSTQRNVDSSKAGYPQDTTPGVWDVNYYNETLDATENGCIFKFESDIKLSKHPAMAGEWQKFVGGQEHWNGDYAKAYLRLSLLGVRNINELKECTLTLPGHKATVPKDADIDVSGKCHVSSSSSLISSTTTAAPEMTSSIPIMDTTTSTDPPIIDVAVDNTTTITSYSASSTSETTIVSAVEVFSLASETLAVSSSGFALISETSTPAAEVTVTGLENSFWASETPAPAPEDSSLSWSSLQSYSSSSRLALESSFLSKASEATTTAEPLTLVTTVPLEAVSNSVAPIQTPSPQLPSSSLDIISDLYLSTSVAASTSVDSSSLVDYSTTPSAVVESITILPSSATSATPSLGSESNPFTETLSIVDALTSTMSLLDIPPSAIIAIDGTPTSSQPQLTLSEFVSPTMSMTSGMISSVADSPSSSPVAPESSSTIPSIGESTSHISDPASTTQSEIPSSSTPISSMTTLINAPELNAEKFTSGETLLSSFNSDHSLSSIFSGLSISPIATSTSMSSHAESSISSSVTAESRSMNSAVVAGPPTTGLSDSRSQATSSTVSTFAHPTVQDLVTNTPTTRISTQQSSSSAGSASLPPVPRVSKSSTIRSASIARPGSTTCTTSLKRFITPVKKATSTHESTAWPTMKSGMSIRPTPTRHDPTIRSNTASTKTSTSKSMPVSNRRSASATRSISTSKTIRGASSAKSLPRTTTSLRVHKTLGFTGRAMTSSTIPTSRAKSTSKVVSKSLTVKTSSCRSTTKSRTFHAGRPSTVPSKESSTRSISSNVSQARKTPLPGKATSTPQRLLPSSTSRNIPIQPKSSSAVPQPARVILANNAGKASFLSTSSILSPTPASPSRSGTSSKPSSRSAMSSAATRTPATVPGTSTSTSKFHAAITSPVTAKTSYAPPQLLSTLSSSTMPSASLLKPSVSSSSSQSLVSASSTSRSSASPQPPSSAPSAIPITSSIPSPTTSPSSSSLIKSSTPGSSSPHRLISTISSTPTLASTSSSTSTSMVSSTSTCSMISMSAIGTYTASMRCWSSSSTMVVTTSRRL